MQTPPNAEQRQATARRRAELILQVRSGQLSASQAAAQMGVSRKTYYKWERRALAAMVSALGEKAGGRPPAPSDPEKDSLQQENQQLRQKLAVLEQTMEIRRLLAEPDKKKE
jgi:transposase-like protein